ncbi:hypothetical protein HQN87_28010 [Paenibacillus tritici]|uniref:Molecular chaperone DnaJ n=1 Tax=Paenibacillus tritici TaxID=1873425 RepID=A0ABX2DYX7_9BACL|nr:hypothetical protein [Paenibacillus tritici]NQX49173.1 hypothetical protein [Paenibacillus tritici]QUL57243.1 hypothetical protein KDC22_12695 [Paenibacillus tritici]
MNDNLKQAYVRLDLPETVTREELNKRFDLLLKRRRALSTDEEIAAYEADFRAYKLILDTWDEQEIQQAEDERLAKYGRFSGTASKWETFMRLYKTHVILGIIGVLVLIFGGKALYDNYQHRQYLASLPPVDATIMFIGNFGAKDTSGKTDELEKAIVAAYPEWKRVEANIVYLPRTGEGSDTLDMNHMQKAVVELAANRPDILILDEATVDWIGGQTGFQNLEPITADGKLAADDTRMKWGVNEETGKNELFGVDILKSPFISAMPIDYNAKSIIISVLGESNKDKLMAFVKHIAEEPAVK